MDSQRGARVDEAPGSPSWAALGVFAASAVGYGLGVYIGVVALFAFLGLEGLAGAPWDTATIGLGSILAGIGATLATPRSGWAFLLIAGGLGTAAVVVSALIDGGLEFAVGSGGVIAVALATTRYISR